MVDLEKLADLARAATEGPWKADCSRTDRYLDTVYGFYQNGQADSIAMVGRSTIEQQSADSEYIAACSPDVILALIERVREAQHQGANELEQRLWSIIDRDGLGDVPSDIVGAVDRLVRQAERATRAEAELKTVLDREAESHRRHDEKVERLEAERDALRELLHYVFNHPMTHVSEFVETKILAALQDKDSSK